MFLKQFDNCCLENIYSSTRKSMTPSKTMPWSNCKTLIQTGITYKKFQIEFGMPLKKSATRYKQKTKTFFNQLTKTSILVLVNKGKQRFESEIEGKSAGIIITVIFI